MHRWRQNDNPVLRSTADDACRPRLLNVFSATRDWRDFWTSKTAAAAAAAVASRLKRPGRRQGCKAPARETKAPLDPPALSRLRIFMDYPFASSAALDALPPSLAGCARQPRLSGQGPLPGWARGPCPERSSWIARDCVNWQAYSLPVAEPCHRRQPPYPCCFASLITLVNQL